MLAVTAVVDEGSDVVTDRFAVEVGRLIERNRPGLAVLRSTDASVFHRRGQDEEDLAVSAAVNREGRVERRLTDGHASLTHR